MSTQKTLAGDLNYVNQNPEAARLNLKMAQTLAPYLFEPFYNGGEELAVFRNPSGCSVYSSRAGHLWVKPVLNQTVHFALFAAYIGSICRSFVLRRDQTSFQGPFFPSTAQCLFRVKQRF